MNDCTSRTVPVRTASGALMVSLLACGAFADVTYTNGELTQMADALAHPNRTQTHEKEEVFETKAKCVAEVRQSTASYYATAKHVDDNQRFKITAYDPAKFRRARCDREAADTTAADDAGATVVQWQWRFNLREFDYATPKWQKPADEEEGTGTGATGQ